MSADHLDAVPHFATSLSRRNADPCREAASILLTLKYRDGDTVPPSKSVSTGCRQNSSHACKSTPLPMFDTDDGNTDTDTIAYSSDPDDNIPLSQLAVKSRRERGLHEKLPRACKKPTGRLHVHEVNLKKTTG